MWLLKLLDCITDFFVTIEIIKDIKENGWNWRSFFWTTAFTAGLCGAALLLTNGHPVFGALGIIGIVAFGFVLVIRRALRSEKDKK